MAPAASSPSARASYSPDPAASAHPTNALIDSSFLTAFEDHRGQTLLWQKDIEGEPIRTDQMACADHVRWLQNAGRTLDGAEFAALPSGLHLVENDTFYFTHTFHGAKVSRKGASTSEDEADGRLAVTVFKNREMTPQEVERGMTGRPAGSTSTAIAPGRGRIMMSLGVVLCTSYSKQTGVIRLILEADPSSSRVQLSAFNRAPRAARALQSLLGYLSTVSGARSLASGATGRCI